MYMPVEQHQPHQQRMNIKHEDRQMNGGESEKKKKKKKPFDPYRPKKQLSKVWKAFRDTPDGAYCNYCGALRKRNDSSTKSLWEHLKQKHVDVLKSLKGDLEATGHTGASTSVPTTKTTSNLGADLQNVCTSLLQGSNTYDATSANSFNIMATLQGAGAPSHQLFSGFGLGSNGALTSAVTSADRHGSVLDMLAAGSAQGGRQGNVFGHVGRVMSSRPNMIAIHRWRVEPVSSKETVGINFILRGIRTDNNSSFTSSELQADMGNGTYKTVTGDLIQVTGVTENENKDLFRNSYQLWHQLILQQLLRTTLK